MPGICDRVPIDRRTIAKKLVGEWGEGHYMREAEQFLIKVHDRDRHVKLQRRYGPGPAGLLPGVDHLTKISCGDRTTWTTRGLRA